MQTPSRYDTYLAAAYAYDEAIRKRKPDAEIHALRDRCLSALDAWLDETKRRAA